MRILALAAGLLILQQTPPVAPASIQGAIVDAVSNEPLRNARVGMTPVNPRPGFRAIAEQTTDGEGRYAFRDLAPGQYRVRAVADGYAQQEYGAKDSGSKGRGTGTVLNLGAGDSRREIVMRLTTAGTVTGRVYNLFGSSLVGMEVVLLRPAFDEFGRRIFMPEGAVRSDDKGQYRLMDVAPGNYRLCAGPPALSATSLPKVSVGTPPPSVRPPDVPTEPGRFQTSCFARAGEPANASDVEVSSRRVTPEIDFHLTRQASAYRIRGRVIDDATGLPPKEFPGLALLPRNPIYATMFERTMPYRPDGTFEIQGVLPGSYLLSGILRVLFDPSLSNPVVPHGTVPVDVVGSDVDDVTLRIFQEAVLSARLTTLDQAPDPGLVTLSIVRPRIDSPTPTIRSTPVGPDGTFQYNNLTVGMDYRLRIEKLPPGFYVREARFGNVDLLREPFQVFPPTVPAVEVVLSGKAGSVSGVAVDEKAVSRPGTPIVLVPDPPGDRPDLYKVVTTDSGGRFNIPNVVPGSYRVFAWSSVEPFSYFDKDLLREAEAKSIPIQIPESASVTLEMRVSP